MYMVGQNGDAVFQYSLSTAYDVSTASYDSVSFSISGQADSPSSLAFNQDGSKLYVLDAGSDFVYQYTAAATSTLTWPTSIEWAGGVAPAAPANGETDVFTFVTDDSGTSYIGLKSADNLS
jgi:DNA-binding beta-propeller fold protein YncE